MVTTANVNHQKRDVLSALALAGALLVVAIVDRSLSATGAEIVFIIDQRPVMKSLRGAIRDRCRETAKSLDAQGMKCRLAVIPFGGDQSHLPSIELTDDMKAFGDRLQSDSVNGAPADSTAVSAMERALKWEFRKGEPVIFYLISATPFASADDVRDVSRQLDERGISTIIQTAEESQVACQPLLDNGARLITFEGKDLKSTRRSSKSGTRAASLVAKLSSQAGVSISVGGLYSARTSSNRMEIVTKGGGTVKSEAAVAAGLDWLARHQADDGHWSDHGKCEANACPISHFIYGATHAETGLAILAFQAQGHYDFNQQPYSAVVGRGLDWLVEQQKEDGSWFGPVATWYEHGIATFAMAEACAVAYANRHEPNRRYLYAAQRAVQFIQSHQYAQGGWQYQLSSQSSGDSSVTGWQMLALKSAIEAEIPVSEDTLERAKGFYSRCRMEDTGQTSYMPDSRSPSDLTTAVGLIVQHLIAKTPESPFAIKATQHLAQKAREGIGESGDYYTLYNGNLAMFLAGKEDWTTWNDKVREEIIRQQEVSGCARGSWDGRHWAVQKHGRTLDTAWAILALEVYYRYSPDGYVPKREH